MQAQTYLDILMTWQPKYKIVLRGAPVYVNGFEETSFTWRESEMILTEESITEGLEIAQRALEADKIWHDANRQIATTIAKAQILAAVPKVYKANNIALTVCPDSGDHQTMLQIADIVASVSAVHGGKYVIEQRSKPGENPYGWHLHFMIQTTYAPSKLKQFVQQKLASRGYVATYYATQADSNWLTKYMSGAKGNSDKDQKVNQDRLLRQQYGLQDIYDIAKTITQS